MRLTTLTDYSLRLLMYVALHPDRLCTISEVAQAYGVSEAHLMKVTHQLGQQGWIETVRGKGGGMRLAQPAADINLGDVVRSMEPDFNLVECFSTGNGCMLTGYCRLTHTLSGALDAFMQHLDAQTLADVLPSPVKTSRSKTSIIKLPAKPKYKPATKAASKRPRAQPRATPPAR